MRPRRKGRNFLPLILLIVVIFSFGGFFGYRYYLGLFEAVNPNDTSPKAFVIEKGASTGDIVAELEQEGLIKSGFAFRQALKDSGKADKIAPGDYKLNTAMNASQIVEKLTTGPDENWITLIEGWRVEQMAERLQAQLGIEKAEFLKYA